MYCPVVPSINHMLVSTLVARRRRGRIDGVDWLARPSTRRRRRAVKTQHATSHAPRSQSTEYSHLR